MPGGTLSVLGKEAFNQAVYMPSVTYPTIAGNASGSNTVTIPGVLAGDIIGWNMISPPAHLVIDNAYVSASNIVTLLWSSDSTGISTGSVAVLFEVARPANASLGLGALPSSVT